MKRKPSQSALPHVLLWWAQTYGSFTGRSRLWYSALDAKADVGLSVWRYEHLIWTAQEDFVVQINFVPQFGITSTKIYMFTSITTLPLWVCFSLSPCLSVSVSLSFYIYIFLACSRLYVKCLGEVSEFTLCVICLCNNYGYLVEQAKHWLKNPMQKMLILKFQIPHRCSWK